MYMHAKKYATLMLKELTSDFIDKFLTMSLETI